MRYFPASVAPFTILKEKFMPLGVPHIFLKVEKPQKVSNFITAPGPKVQWINYQVIRRLNTPFWRSFKILIEIDEFDFKRFWNTIEKMNNPFDGLFQEGKAHLPSAEYPGLYYTASVKFLRILAVYNNL